MSKKKIVIPIIILVLVAIFTYAGMNFSKLRGNVLGSSLSDDENVEICNVESMSESYMEIKGSLLQDYGESGYATITVIGDDEYTKLVNVKTNNKSTFNLKLKKGTYTIRIEKEGYESYEKEISDNSKLDVVLHNNGVEKVVVKGKVGDNAYYTYHEDGMLYLKGSGKTYDADKYNNSILNDVINNYLIDNNIELNDDQKSFLYELINVGEVIGSNINGLSSRLDVVKQNIENDVCENECDLTSSFKNKFNNNEIISIINVLNSIPKNSKVVISDDITSLGTNIFSNTVISNLRINENIKEIKYGAFDGASIGTLTLNKEITKVNYKINGASINNLVIPNSITKIGDNAFLGNNIKYVTLSSKLEEIGKNAFANNKIEAVSLPSSLKIVKENAFYNNDIKNITIPRKLTDIEKNAFSKNNIEIVNLYSNIKTDYSKGNNIFSNNEKDIVLNVQEGVKKIPDYAFYNSKITRIFLPTTLEEIGKESFANNNIDYIELKSDFNCDDEYENAPFNNNGVNPIISIDDSVIEIKDNVFYNANIKEIHLNNVQIIGKNAFRKNEIDEISFNKELTTIKENAFYNNNINRLEIPKKLTLIEKNAFSKNDITYIELNSNLKDIYDDNSTMLNTKEGLTVVVTDSVSNVPEYTFYNMGVENVIISKKTGELEDNSFAGNDETFKMVTIQGKNYRYNDRWEEIGFPEDLMPIKNTLWEYDYNGTDGTDGTEQTFKVPYTGYYKLETWGAQGGMALCNNKLCGIPGYGGYSTGVVYLTKGQTLYINVGGKGQNGLYKANANGGYNGGGSATWDNHDDESGGAGGGATHIATTSGLLSTLENNKDSILIVSGAGGGNSWTYAPGSGGGHKGSYTSTTSQLEVSQTTGYAFGKGQDAVGNGGDDGIGGPGAGYYGGYMNNVSKKSSGQGGSGFIANLLSTTTYQKHMTCYNCMKSKKKNMKTNTTENASDVAISDYAKEGNGYAKITLID